MHKPHQQTDKALLALERESWKLSRAKWTKVPLNPPIRRGWKRCYFLTQAARQRPDVSVLELILEKINNTRKHWRRDFSPTKRNCRRQMHHFDQKLQMLEGYHFGPRRGQLPEDWRSYFVRMPVFEHKVVTWKWDFRLPELFELRIVPNLQIEAHVLNPDAERRLAEIDHKLHPKGWARLNKLHGCRIRRYDEDSAKETEAVRNARRRISAAYQGDREAEKSILIGLDAPFCFVRVSQAQLRLLWHRHSCQIPQTTIMTAAIASSATPVDPKELRLLVHAELGKLPDEYLAAARQLLLEMQMQQVLESMDDAADAVRAAGRLTPERVAGAIAEYRAAHPYRR